MQALHRLTIPQRVVLVVGFGLLLATGWAWWYFTEPTPTGDWFAYAPNEPTTSTDTYYVVRDRSAAAIVVPALLVVIWMAASLWLLGLRRPNEEID